MPVSRPPAAPARQSPTKPRSGVNFRNIHLGNASNRRALAFLAGLVLSGCAMAADPPPAPTRTPLTWPDLLKRERPKADATISYGPAAEQKVDVWLPKGKAPHRTVLMVHGGCWQTDIADRTLMDWIANDLRAHGDAVWNIDYRGVDREGGGYPGTFRDAAAAADALRDHATRFGLDTNRVVAVGHSAGGHLALWLAGRPKLPKDSPLAGGKPLPIAHVVSLGGLPDLEQARAEEQGCGAAVIDRLVGPPTLSSRQVYRDTSIPWLAPLGVAQTLVNGDADRIIPTHFAADYAAKMRKAGDQVAVEIVPNTGHVELVAPETAAWAETRRQIDAAFAAPPRVR